MLRFPKITAVVQSVHGSVALTWVIAAGRRSGKAAPTQRPSGQCRRLTLHWIATEEVWGRR